MTTVVYRDPTFLDHDPGEAHPENARRLAAVYESLDLRPVAGTRYEEPRRARWTEIERVHHRAYVEKVARTEGLGRVPLDLDTATSPRSYEAALLAAGSTLRGVEAVVSGEATGAFALVRPPGHHAEADYAKGFCLFNNVAIGAVHALKAGGLRRVLVVDPDVHHGNGTQHAFWDRPEVLYVSSHRYPFYPGTGAATEIGAGRGRGYTVNLPHPAGTGDADLLHLYEAVASPIVRAFEPELILVSAGFDTWRADPLGGFAVTERGFEALFGMVRRWADASCPGRIVCALEGGYDPAGVVLGVRAALEAMTAKETPEVRVGGRPTTQARTTADRLRHLLAPHWPSVAG